MVHHELLDRVEFVKRHIATNDEEVFNRTESATLVSIDQQLVSEEDECMRTLNLTAPVGRMPDEILCHIFQLVINEIDEESYNFTSTVYYLRRASILSACSRWLCMTISTPSLWAYVRFDCRSRGPLPLAALHADLARSRSAPLKIDIRLPEDATKPESTTALDLFRPHLHRCWRLDVMGPAHHLLPIDMATPSLEFLSTYDSGKDGNDDRTEGCRSFLSNPGLNITKLLVTVVSPLSVIIEPHHIRPSLITHLTFNANCEDHSAWALFAACTSLVRLRWHSKHASPDPTTKIHLRHLHTLILYQISPFLKLKWIEAPNLLNLRFGTIRVRTGIDDDVLEGFPLLKHVHANTALWTTPHGAPRLLVSHPRLEHATLTNL